VVTKDLKNLESPFKLTKPITSFTEISETLSPLTKKIPNEKNSTFLEDPFNFESCFNFNSDDINTEINQDYSDIDLKELFQSLKLPNPPTPNPLSIHLKPHK
jgi:hypothetical protein